MVTRFEARNPRGNVLSLVLADTNQGIIVEEIEGLDPVKATIVTSTFAGLDGEQYQTSRREARDIVLKLGLEGSYGGTSARALRDKLYNWFMPKSEVNLRFFTEDGLIVHITGRVESFSAPLFVQEPLATISIRCFNSDFLELTAETKEFYTAPLGSAAPLQFPYAGSLEAGITLSLNIDRAISGFDMLHRGEDAITRTMEFDIDLSAGDVLQVVTTPGAKRVTRIRNGASVSQLYGVSPKSIWTLFTPGSNQIRVLTPGDPLRYTISVTKRYGGL